MDAFAALADPTRRRVVELLARHGALTAGELAGRFESARPTISRHLRTLREAGIVRSRAVSQERHYMLEPASLAKMEAWLARHRTLWSQRLGKLQRLVEDDVAERRSEEAR
jgi:DNA-binding transcriptional ArsR family regulator